MPQIKVPVEWLREYVDIDVPVSELARLLHMSGTEVDKVERAGDPWDKVWVGRIAALERHPDADKLFLATVDYGLGRIKTVVTGATNLVVGAVVPYAETGATVRDGHGDGIAMMTLEPRKMRGILSEGMVLSAKELGLGADHEGILLLDAALPVGAALGDVLGESVLHIELQPNRPDCMGILGIAREVAAITGRAVHEPAVDALEFGSLGDALTIRIEDETACTRFAAALLTGVRTGPSPEWMQRRLQAAGMRAIDVIVDITNYVMLELGQPLHGYDADRLAGRTLAARQAAIGERLRTLDGVDRALPAGTLVIADGRRALGIAGILGGEDSEIRPDTTTVALECASFEGRGIGRTATTLGLGAQSTASRRFALTLSPELVPLALGRAVRLLREHAGASVAGAVDVHPQPRPVATVRLPVADIARVLGVGTTAEEATDALSRLGFGVGRAGDVLVATAPPLRTDIAIPEDLIEEIARITGYDRIPTRIPDGPLPVHEPHPLPELRERVRDLLVGFGLTETVSYSLIDPAWLAQLTADGSPIAPAPLCVQNPTSTAQSAPRPTLRASLLDTARHNLRHEPGIAIFEIAPAYLPRVADLPEERWTVAILLAGKAETASWLGPDRLYGLPDAAAIMDGLTRAVRLPRPTRVPGAAGLHPGRSETRSADDQTLAVWGQLDPSVAARWDLPAESFVIELDLATMLSCAGRGAASAPPRYPAALRDLAIVVEDGQAYDDVQQAILDAGKGLVISVALLDRYRGPQVAAGHTSYAVRLVFRSPDATLTDADVDRSVKRITGKLLHQLGATIR
ncbi:MAG TPA: phenylalanine--tRNA ligase subunit beta [Candidatus Saccharimonadales bacterium]|nr:phenylalanine--tRNA ligase subunit beta [Candidatus Saccharimonadales bacterium]